VDGLAAPDGTAGCLLAAAEAAAGGTVAGAWGRPLAGAGRGARRCQAALARGSRRFVLATLAAAHRCVGRADAGHPDATAALCDAADTARTGRALRATVAGGCDDASAADLFACGLALDDLVRPPGDGGCVVGTGREAAARVLAAEVSGR
jgi:hypothetical protein